MDDSGSNTLLIGSLRNCLWNVSTAGNSYAWKCTMVYSLPIENYTAVLLIDCYLFCMVTEC